MNGSVSTNSDNLFSVLTVTSATGSEAPAVEAQAFALEMPGSSTFIVPFGESLPLVATAISTCPSSNFAANWVITRPRMDRVNDEDPNSSLEFKPDNFNTDGAGTAVYTALTDSFVVRSSGIVDGVLEAGTSDGFLLQMASQCTAGKLSVTHNDSAFDMYFTPTGQMVVKFPEGEGNQIISGFPQTAEAVTSASLDGTYSVLVYRGGETIDLSEAEVAPAILTWAPNAGGAIRLISNVEDNTEASGDLFTLGSFSVTSNTDVDMPKGQFRLTLGDNAGQMTCVTTDGTPRVIACFGWYDTGDGAEEDRRPITVLGRKR